MAKDPVKVDAMELLEAFEVANVNAPGYENKAFVSRSTGKTYIVFGDIGLSEDQEILEDLDTSDDYLHPPNKRELGLGSDLVFAFVNEQMPDDWQKVRNFFGRRGAYARFKDLLDERGKLQAWYEFEERSTREALRDWCESEGLEPVGPWDHRGSRTNGTP